MVQDPMIQILRKHLDTTLAMLKNIIDQCPDSAWTTDEPCLAVWQQTYHALLGTAIWLHWPSPVIAFPPFHRDGIDNQVGAAPAYDRATIAAYQKEVFALVEAYFERLTPENLTEEIVLRGKRLSRADFILGQIRHVQHHVGCIHAQLRHRTGTSPEWL